MIFPKDVDARKIFLVILGVFYLIMAPCFFSSLVKNSQPNFHLYFKKELSIFTIYFNSDYFLACCYPFCLSGTRVQAKNE